MSAGIASVEEWSGKDRGDENFPVGSLLIRPALRRHVHAFYAFARNADDIADSAVLLPAEKIARLDVMEAVLLGEQASGSPSATGLRSSLAETGISEKHSCDLLRAFRQDATKNRYATWNELLDYCRYSAMPVGRHVLDLHDEDSCTHEPSDALCASLQVLNHLQDCQADLRALDRCYLPEDLLEQHGASVGDLTAGAASAGLQGCFAVMLDEVEKLNRAAEALPLLVRSRRLRLETAVILGLAQRLTRRLRRGDPVAGRVKLRRVDFAASLLAAWRFVP
jgi:farnesyl-diphosphate farnesyltransferase